jgi:hypothetical protein
LITSRIIAIIRACEGQLQFWPMARWRLLLNSFLPTAISLFSLDFSVRFLPKRVTIDFKSASHLASEKMEEIAVKAKSKNSQLVPAAVSEARHEIRRKTAHSKRRTIIFRSVHLCRGKFNYQTNSKMWKKSKLGYNHIVTAISDP